MNVNLNFNHDSKAIGRLDKALHMYAPADVTWTDYDNADLVIIPVIGRRNHVWRLAGELLKQGRKYAIIQLSLRSTRNPDPNDWQEIWENAQVVWSYYWLDGNFNFYLSPLGADPKLFYPLNYPRDRLVGMTGTYTRAECLWEVEKAARNVGARALKIRAETDEELNQQYNRCLYISGLRHKEGFEMPAVEGMLAGTRPILFDTPDFRRWYDGIAVFIPEGNVLHTVNQLTKLFSAEPEPVLPKEVMYTRYRFDWEHIIHGFFDRCI